MKWLLGLYYQYDMARFPAKAFPTAEYRIGFPENVLDIYLWGDTPKETAAVFGQVSYDISDRLQLQLGARYAHSVSTNDDVYTTYPQFGIVLFQDDEVKDDKVTGKVTLNWKVDESNFVYGFVATGHKGGGLNAPNLYRPALTFGPEDLVDYELGWKSTLLGGRLRSQVGAYYTVYQDFQVNIGDPQFPQVSRIQNIQGDTTLMGLEASLQGQFGPLSFDVAGSCPAPRWATSSARTRGWDGRASAIRRRVRRAPTASTSRATPRATPPRPPSTPGSNTPSLSART